MEKTTLGKALSTAQCSALARQLQMADDQVHADYRALHARLGEISRAKLRYLGLDEGTKFWFAEPTPFDQADTALFQAFCDLYHAYQVDGHPYYLLQQYQRMHRQAELALARVAGIAEAAYSKSDKELEG